MSWRKGPSAESVRAVLWPRTSSRRHPTQLASMAVGKANTALLSQRHGPTAARNYAAAVYYNLYGPLPTQWDWLAGEHLVKPPPPLNPEDSRMVDEGNSQGAFDDESAPLDSPALPSLAPSTPSLAAQPQKIVKPPPPIYPTRFSHSPAKSSCPSKGTRPWEGDWNQQRDSPWDWQTRKWHR